MTDSLNNKELIAVGHEFARTLSSNTPIIDIAKMFTRLAERLDCTTAALREKGKQCDALAAEKESLAVECAAAKIALEYMKSGRQDFALSTPATDSFLAEVTREAVEPLKKEIEGLRERIARVVRAAMPQSAETTESRCTIQTAPVLDSLPKNAGSPSSNPPVIPDCSTIGLFNSARALLDSLYEFGPDEVAISEYVTNLEDALRNSAAPQQEV